MKFESRPFPGSGGRTGGTRVIDSPLGVQAKIIVGLRHIIPTEQLEEMPLQEAEALFKKTYGNLKVIRDSDLKEPTRRVLKLLKIDETEFHQVVNRFIPQSLKAPITPQPKPTAEAPQKKSYEPIKEFTKEEKFNILIINAMKKNFGASDLIRMKLNRQKPDVYQDHYLSVAKQYNEEAGLGSFMPELAIPILPNNEYSRAALQAGSIGADQYPSYKIEDFAPILNDLKPTIIQGNKPAKNLGVVSGSGAWLGQTSANDDATGAISKISFSDLRYSFSQPVSKLLLLQGGPAVEKLLIDQLGKALMNGVLGTLLGVAARTSTQPQGIGWTCTASPLATAAAAPGLGTLDDLEGALDTAGAPVGLRAYVTNTRGARILKRAPAEVGMSGRYLMEDGKVNGWPCFISNAVSAAAGSGADGNLLIYANWDDLVLSQTGTILIELDPYSRAKSNLVIVTMSGFFDWKSARGTASTGEGTDVNEFGVSFAACAIK